MAAGYGAALKAIAGGVDGFLQGSQQNKQRGQVLAAYKSLPKVPDLQNEYLQGYLKQLQYTPQVLALDRQLRAQYLPQDLQQAAALYRTYLPQFAQGGLRALQKVDPQYLAGRSQLFQTVSGDLGMGSGLDPAFRDELTDYLRGAQAARGNLFGNAPVLAEALYQGQAGQKLKQQRVQNMLSFLKAPGPEEKMKAFGTSGQDALAKALGAAVNPGYSYVEGPKGWGEVYLKAAQSQFTDANAQALAKARALAAAPPETNPWLTSLAGGLNGLASAGGGSGKGGGGGFF